MKIMGWAFGFAFWWEVGYTLPIAGAAALVTGEVAEAGSAATKTLRVSAVVGIVRLCFDWKLENRPPVVEWRV